MELLKFIAIYIFPSILLAGILAPILGKPINRFIEYLLNKMRKK